MIILLTIPGQPVSAKNSKRGFVRRTRAGKYVASVVNSEAVDRWYEQTVPKLRDQFRAHHMPPIAQLVTIDVMIYYRDDILHQHSADRDNVLSAAQDALVKAGVLADDRYIKRGQFDCEGHSSNPRVEIEISYAVQEARVA